MDPYQNHTDSLNARELPVSRRHFLNKKFALTLALVLVCAGGVYAGLWYWQNQNSNAVVPSATPNQNSVDTSTWKTFTNQKFDYELKYPNNWVVDDTYSETGFEVRGGGDVIGGDTFWQNYDWPHVGPDPEPSDHRSLYLLVYQDKNINTVEDFAKKNYEIDRVNPATKLLESHDFSTQKGITGKEYSFESLDHPVGEKTSIIIFQKDKNFYVFSTSWQSKSIDEQILSTFKFTDSTDTSTWKTYTNSQFGFQMGYPSANSNDVVQGGSDSVLYDGLSVIEGPTIDAGPYTIIPATSDKQKGEMTTWMNRYLNQADTKATGLSSNDRLVCQRLSVSNPLVTAVHCSDSIDQTTFALIKNGSVWVFLHSSKNNNSLVPTSEQELKTLSMFKFINSTDTSTWKTYTNTQYGITFKYPPDLILTENPYGDRSSIGLPLELSFITQGGQSNKYSFILTTTSMSALIASREKYNPDDILLGSLPAKEDILPAQRNGDFAQEEVYTDLGAYRFLAVSEVGSDSTFDQILSTFKFTK